MIATLFLNQKKIIKHSNNFQTQINETQVEDHSEPTTQKINPEKSEELEEHPIHEVVTPSTSKGKAATIKIKRVSQISTSQSLPERKRKPENAIDHAINHSKLVQRTGG